MEAAAESGSTASSAGNETSARRCLEDYQLGHTLGQGHFAQVKLAQKLSTGEYVALKIIEIDDQKPRQQELIFRELTAMAQVQHANVLRLSRTLDRVPYPKENGVFREVLLLELELAPGGELFDYILTGGAFPEPVARAYFYQLMSALEACHRLGIYHRDIKPENILLGDRYQLKVGDFGLASLASHPGELLRTPCGTRSYQAPEVLARQPYQGDKADIWSAGVVLFIMLAGNPPMTMATKTDWWYNAISLGEYGQFWRAHQRAPAPKIYEAAQAVVNSILVEDPTGRAGVVDLLAHPWIEHGSPDYPEATSPSNPNATSTTPLPSAAYLEAFMGQRKAVIDEKNRAQREQARITRRRKQQQQQEASSQKTFNPHKQSVVRSTDKEAAGMVTERLPLALPHTGRPFPFNFYATETPHQLLLWIEAACSGSNVAGSERLVDVHADEHSVDAVLGGTVNNRVRLLIQIWRVPQDMDDAKSEDEGALYCVTGTRLEGSPWDFTAAWRELLTAVAAGGCDGAGDALQSLKSPALYSPTDVDAKGMGMGALVGEQKRPSTATAEDKLSDEFDEKMVM